MKAEDHIKRYLRMKSTINELLKKPLLERDHASILILIHWASYHLVSTIIDQLLIPEKLKHRNHRGIKKTLKDTEIMKILGKDANKILKLYNLLEMDFSSKFQYGYINNIPDYSRVIQILKELEDICKKITKKVQKEVGKN